MEWLGKALANSRKGGEEEEETQACGKCVASLCAVFAKTPRLFFVCVGILFGFSPWINTLVVKKINDTLLKRVIDWMFGWMGSDCPPACKLGCSTSRGLNMIKPPPPDMMASYLAKRFPLHNHKSQLMRRRAFSFHSANPHHPAAHKQERSSATAATRETWREQHACCSDAILVFLSLRSFGTCCLV